MTFENAWIAVMHAGRQMGSGPHLAVLRIVPNADDISLRLHNGGIKEDRAGGILVGLAVGLVMAEDPTALETLIQIDNEWREHRNDD